MFKAKEDLSTAAGVAWRRPTDAVCKSVPHLGPRLSIFQRISGLHRPLTRMDAGFQFHPGSELATHAWLAQRSGLGELMDFNFEAMDLNRLY